MVVGTSVMGTKSHSHRTAFSDPSHTNQPTPAPILYPTTDPTKAFSPLFPQTTPQFCHLFLPTDLQDIA
jgi:hypothetical protein